MVSDFTLLQGARRGQEGPFQELARRHQDFLLNFARAEMKKGYRGTVQPDHLVTDILLEVRQILVTDGDRVTDFPAFAGELIRERVLDLKSAIPTDPHDRAIDETGAVHVEGRVPTAPPAGSEPLDFGKAVAILEAAGATDAHVKAYRMKREGLDRATIAEALGESMETTRRRLQDCAQAIASSLSGKEIAPIPRRDRKKKGKVPKKTMNPVSAPALEGRLVPKKPPGIEPLEALQGSRRGPEERASDPMEAVRHLAAEAQARMATAVEEVQNDAAERIAKIRSRYIQQLEELLNIS